MAVNLPRYISQMRSSSGSFISRQFSKQIVIPVCHVVLDIVFYFLFIISNVLIEIDCGKKYSVLC